MTAVVRRPRPIVVAIDATLSPGRAGAEDGVAWWDAWADTIEGLARAHRDRLHGPRERIAVVGDRTRVTGGPPLARSD